ncbi:hypothetical protein AKO1_012178 [Acrasis kona]|uniref:PH domain-containing protein n=1 Tax=Acrasis kona TaxID=1008807 RepID=A0AAW2ZCY9_9EUKA
MKLFKRTNKITSPNSPTENVRSPVRSPSAKESNMFASVTSSAVVSDADNIGKLIHPEKLYDEKPGTTGMLSIPANDPFLTEGRIFNDNDNVILKRSFSSKINIKIDKGTKIDREGWLVKEGRVVKNNKLTISKEEMLDTCIIRIAKNRTGVEHLNCLELINTAVSETALPVATASNDDDDDEEEESIRTLFFDAVDDKDRHEWFVAITNKIALLKYQRQMKTSKKKDDPRIINLFDTPNTKEFDLSKASESLADDTQEGPTSPTKNKTSKHYEAMVAVRDPIRLSMTLQTINLEQAQIGDNGVKEIAEALKENKSVTRLNLSGNGITAAGMTFITSMLSTNTTLMYIDLSHNSLVDESIKILCDGALKVNTNINLKTLNLQNNAIADKGVEYFVDSLMSNPKLKSIESLNLSHNQIGDAGCEHIAKLLDFQSKLSNVAMTVIDLGYNLLANDGAKLISKAMGSNKNIKQLNLEFNQIGYQGTKDLAFCCVKNTHVEKLVLGGNRLGEQALYLLANTSMTFPEFMLSSK